eukprot:gene9948-10999_t
MTDSASSSMALLPSGEIYEGNHFLLRGPDNVSDLVIFFHGTGYHLTYFHDLASHLHAFNFQTLQYDLIGRGFSSPSSNGKYGVEEHVGQLEHLLSSLHLTQRKLHLIGHSFGGALATIYASKHSEDIQTLILLAPAGLINSMPLAFIRNAPLLRRGLKNTQIQRSNRLKAWRSDFFSHSGIALEIEDSWIRELSSLYDSRPEVFDGYFNSLMQFPLYGIESYLDQVAANGNLTVSLFWGREDKAMTLKPHFDRFCQHLAGKACAFSTKIFDQAGHGFLLEKKDEVHEAITKVLVASRKQAQS